MAAAPVAKPRAVNDKLTVLSAELSAEAAAGRLDGYGTYVYALTLRELERAEEALAALKRSVQLTPCLWAAWCEIASLRADGEVERSVDFSSHWMADFYCAHAAIEAQQNNLAIELYEKLLVGFPASPYVKCQLALAKYNLREFDEAQGAFETLMAEDPYRLDQVDTYSNILYVKEAKRTLSALAHKCVSIDKYRPESCCVIGNYYSLKGEHEKAVLYFRRALKLNRSFLSAWTLMGHEYVELKNTAAAVDAYRHAVDINAKDYRAWYGLGQTYEILQMPFYALFYYRKATALRPYDARMWCAMAGCYKLLNRKQDAIKCYQRAESNHDREGIAYSELARLFRDEGDKDQAAHYYRETLRLNEQQEASGPDPETISDALEFLGGYCKDMGALDEAQTYCTRLLDRGGSHQVDVAKALLRDIRSQYAQQTPVASGGALGN